MGDRETWRETCLLERIRVLDEEIQRTSDKDHPNPEPLVVFSALRDVLADRSSKLSAGMQIYKTDSALHVQLREATYESAAAEVAQVARLFSCVDRVDSTRIPFELLRALSWAGEGMLGDHLRIVVRLDPDHSYSITTVERLFAEAGFAVEWAKHGKRTTGKTVVLGMPSAEAQSILLHALSAHELAHELFAKHEAELLGLAERVAGAAGATDETLRSVVLGEPLDVTGGARRPGWAAEVFADLVGARLLGPAHIAASARVLLGHSAHSHSHPSATYRYDVVDRYIKDRLPHLLDGTDWAPVMAGSKPTQRTIKPAQGGFGDLFGAAEEWCRAVEPVFAGWLDRLDTPLLYPDLPKLVLAMDEHLCHLSPPSVPLRESAAFGDWREFWAIFYAGWRQRAAPGRFSAFCTRLGADPVRGERGLGSLVLQAVRAAELGDRLRRNAAERRTS